MMRPRVAVPDDWQRIVRLSADWTCLVERADLTLFHELLGSIEQATALLKSFDILVAMRERQAFPAALVAALPRLRMIAFCGGRAPSMDMTALSERGVVVSRTGVPPSGSYASELALGLILASERHIALGDAAMRAGGFQESLPLGRLLGNRTLGIVGLGRVGTRVARAATALDMRVLAWSQNLTEEAAAAAGAERVEKEQLLAKSDVVTLHLVSSERTRHVIGARELARMRAGTLLVNTARAPLVDEDALLAAFRERRVRAALDVFSVEPLPADHPLRSVPGVVLTPHLGYVVEEVMPHFYRESVANILAFLDGAPVNVLNAPVAGWLPREPEVT